jgi:hypothetical protein
MPIVRLWGENPDSYYLSDLRAVPCDVGGIISSQTGAPPDRSDDTERSIMPDICPGLAQRVVSCLLRVW